MMKAIVQNGYGPPEQVLSLTEVPRPVSVVDPNGVLLRVRAASVNTPDWAHAMGIPYILRPIIAGLFRTPKNCSTLGTDVAGIVEQVGSHVTHLKPGDAVFGSTENGIFNSKGYGAFCEYTIAPAHQLIEKPESISFEDAAGSVMSGITALQAMRDAAQAREGTHVLIHGASGGVGTFAVQFAKALGARVTGVCSTNNVALVKSLGADHVIDYTQQDFTEGTVKYDVILDNVLNKTFKQTSKVLKPNGFIVPNSIGAHRSKWFGAIPSFFIKPKRYPTFECLVNSDNLNQVAQMMESGKVKVITDKVFALEDTPKAVAYMATLRARGKIIIRVVDN